MANVSAYFPDGTWCGNDGQKDLYCLQRTCVSEADGLSRSAGRSSSSGDLEMSNNAPMTAGGIRKLPPALEVVF